MMSIMMIACNNNADESKGNDSINSQETQKSEGNSELDQEKDSEIEVDKENLKTVKVPIGSIYADCDKTLRAKEEGYSILVYNTNDALVGMCSKSSISHTGEIKDAIEYFKSSFISDASLSSSGNLFGASFEVTSTKEVKMAGRDSVCFTATVSNQGQWDCHVYGYVFVIDEVPCAVIGLVSAQAQDPAMIAEIDARVDQMAATIRTEE